MIRIEHLHKYYNKKSSVRAHAVDDTTISFSETGLVAIFGPSGCGKTTLLNIVGGLDKYDSGTVEIDGSSVSPSATKLRNQYIGYIFQNYNLDETKTVFENVEDALRLCGVTDPDVRKDKVTEALRAVSMDKFVKRFPSSLSGGQQQRVAIARALVKSPRVILADEPTGNLDDANTLQVMKLLKKLSRHCLVLLVTHESDLVDAYCDRVIEISDGRVVSEYENQETNGVVRRSRSDIFLGEMQRHETDLGKIRIEYFGHLDSEEPIRLRLVRQGSTLLLETGSNATVKVLEPNGELQLREGTFEDQVRRKESADVSDDIPFEHVQLEEGNAYGRLYSFKQALKLAFRNVYRSGKKKKGRVFLNALLIIFAVILVSRAASFGTLVKAYFREKNYYVKDAVYVKLDDETLDEDVVRIKSSVSDYYDAYCLDEPSEIAQTIEFVPMSFETFAPLANPVSYTGYFDTGALTGRGVVTDISAAEGTRVLAGTNELTNDDDILISENVARQLIETSPYSYIRKNSDLLNLVSFATWAGTYRFRIVGVVSGSESFFYVKSSVLPALRISKTVLSRIISEDNELIKGLGLEPLEPGTVYVNGFAADMYGSSFTGQVIRKGDQIKLVGHRFTVKDGAGYPFFEDYLNAQSVSFKSMQSISAEIYKEIYGTEPTTEENVSFLEANEDSISAIAAVRICETYGEGFLKYYPVLNTYDKGPAEAILKHSQGDPKLLVMILGGKTKGSVTSGEYYSLPGTYLKGSWSVLTNAPGAVTSYLISLYYEANHTLPDLESDDLEPYRNTFEIKYGMTVENAFEYWSWDYEYREISNPPYVILSQSDFDTVLRSTGFTDTWISGENMYSYKPASPEGSYLLLLSDHPKELRDEIRTLGYGSVLTGSEMFREQFDISNRIAIVASVVTLLIFLIVLSLCVFLLMRATLMSEVHRVGIERAIGTSGKNISFKFFVETLVLLSSNVLPGFLIMSAGTAWMAANPLFSSLLYYPWWMACLVFAVLVGISTLCGMIPVWRLLSKTPVEILSKYDM